MTELVDYSWARPGAAAIKAAGKAGAIRYLFNDGVGGKGLDASEITDLRNNGLTLTLCYEGFGDRAHINAAQGASDGLAARAQLSALGLRLDSVVYFAVDFQAAAADLSQVNAYLAAAKNAVPKAGIYGSFAVCEATKDNTEYRWQTYAWSGSNISQGIRIYQYHNGQTINGGSVDFDRTSLDDYGQVVFDSTTPPSVAPTIVSLPTMASMVLTGAYGNGDSRKAALGAYYTGVQAIVNGQIGNLNHQQVVAVLKAETLAGHYGNGNERAQLLGQWYADVQAAINGK